MDREKEGTNVKNVKRERETGKKDINQHLHREKEVKKITLCHCVCGYLCICVMCAPVLPWPCSSSAVQTSPWPR